MCSAELGKRTSEPKPALLVSFQGLIVLNESSFLSRTSASVGFARLKGFFGGFFRSLAAAGKAQAEGVPELHWRLKITATTKEQLKNMQGNKLQKLPAGHGFSLKMGPSK